MMKKIALVWMLVGSLLLAKKIAHIKYEGLSHLSYSAAEEISGIKVGDILDPAVINDSIKNFFAQGYFSDVWVDKQGNTLIYHFKERVSIVNIDVKGYGSKDEAKDLLKSIGLKKGDLYNKRKITQAQNALVESLERQGYYDTIVEVSTKSIGEGGITLTFDVSKGEKIKIQKMNFIGANHLSQSTIEFDLANKEEDFLGWVPFLNNGVARVDQLEYDVFRVQDVYRKHGYIDAVIDQPLMRVDFGSYKATVDYQVNEGIKYRVGDISISIDTDELKSKKLLSHLVLKKGKIFNIKRMRTDLKYLKEKIGDLGYAYAQVLPQMQKDPESKVVNIQYVLHSGEKVTINDVIIQGNTHTKDRVIRRYLFLAPGDKFNATDLQDSKDALARTGFFEKVDIQSQRISGNTINLLVNIKEARTGTISAGGGYGSFEGAMFNMNYSEKNTLGSGISTNIGFDISKRSTNYNLSVINPKIWDSQYSLGFSLYKKKYEYTNFTQNQLGGSLTLGRDFLRYFHASLGMGYVDNKSERNDNNYTATGTGLENTNVTPTDQSIDLFYSDKYKKTSIFTGLSFDNTDDFYTPRSGMISSINFELATLEGNDVNYTKYPKGYGNYVKTSAKLGLYYGVQDWIDYDLIFRFKGRVSSVDSAKGQKIPVAEKLFMGGIGSVRGYNPYSLTPGENGYVTGGKKRASVTAEASIPLSEAAKMRLTFFYDYGMIGEDSFTEIERSSAGIVIEWRSPMGPINLVFAKALDDKPGDRTSTFEFSMGTKF